MKFAIVLRSSRTHFKIGWREFIDLSKHFVHIWLQARSIYWCKRALLSDYCLRFCCYDELVSFNSQFLNLTLNYVDSAH